jgi:hypothetical protein
MSTPAAGGLRTPTALYSPSYGDPDKTQVHRMVVASTVGMA